MAITCCCGITRKLSNSNHNEDLEQSYIQELATVISPSEVEETVVNVVSRFFIKAVNIKIHWSPRYEEINGNRLISNNINPIEFENFGKLILSSKQMEKAIYSNLFKERKDSHYGIFLPIINPEDATFKAYLLFYTDQWDSKKSKTLEFLEKQISTMFRRLYRIHIMTLCNIGIKESDYHFDKVDNKLISSILALCGDLNDKDPWVLQMKIISFLKLTLYVEGGFILFLSDNNLEYECQVIDSVIINPELRCNVNGSILEKIIKKNKEKIFKEEDIIDRTTDFKRLQDACQYKWRNILSVPIISKLNDSVIAVVCVINKCEEKQFDEEDVHTIQLVFHYTTAVLTSSIAYCTEMKLKTQTEIMLQVAMNIFRKLDNLTVLLKEIITEAKKLTNAERCSVFLLEEETDELVAKVFDGLETVSENSEITVFITPDGLEIEHPKEIRLSIKQGIAGKVASTGEILNILDAYSHPLFYRGVDDSTGYKTKNILCFPIKDENEKVVGVAQLCNKVNGPHFTSYDVELARAFSVYCCISIVHSLMYKTVQEAQHRNKLANELMTYHMQISEENFHWLSTCKIPEVRIFLPDFSSFESIPRKIQERESILAVLGMFQELRFISRWRIPRSVLARFILMVKRGYRDPSYHNWTHAFSVAHFAFLCVMNLNLNNQLTDLEIFSFFVASLCHDIDHRGTNNSFQVTSNSVLAALYSSEGSVLERHHFSQTICILNSEGCNIFENLSRQEYQTALDLIREIILATDLAHHFRIMSQQKEMVEHGYNPKCSEHHKLLLFMLMTCADLSDQIKCWDNTRNVAQLIYEEFFSQGDLEKAIGQKPCEQMDRERACIPNLQLSFLDGVVTPCFQNFRELYNKYGEVMIKNININWNNWEKLNNDIRDGKITPNIFQIFQKDISPFHTVCLDRMV